MKFVHIADMHFDIPFTSLSKKDLGVLRRLEQRRIFKEIVHYIKENEIESFFICGDLYEHDYVKQSTIQYINQLFCEIPNTKIYIVPGNHDPFLKNSYYATFHWNHNVTIFTNKIEKKETSEADIYGFGFNEFYMQNTKLENTMIENPSKLNILLTHGSVDSGSEEDKQYNPMTKKMLTDLAFDYIALGHIHKASYQGEIASHIVYPGSPIAMGFDELGKHGMIVGEITKQKGLKTTFIPLDRQEFVELEVEVNGILTKEELIEKMNELPLKEDHLYKIILIGNRNFEMDVYQIYPYLQPQNILKIKDNTIWAEPLSEIANQQNLKGIFVRNMLRKLEKEPEKQPLIEKAIEIGLQAMN